MKTKIILLLSMFCVVTFSQVNLEWATRYSVMPGEDVGTDLVTDDLGNVYVIGTSVRDIAVIKYNSMGVEQWSKRYNGSATNSRDKAIAIKLDPNGYIYVAGTVEKGSSDLDYILMKYDLQGNEQWIITFADTAGYDEDAAAMCLDLNGNIFITGKFEGVANDDFLTVKYNSAGVLQWAKIYNAGATFEFPKAIMADNSGNIIVTGYRTSTSTGDDYITIKYNNEGVEQWVRFYASSFLDRALALTIGNSGSIYVTGYHDSGTTRSDYTTIKYSSAGVMEWLRKYNGPGNYLDEAYAIAIDQAENIYVTGYSMSNGTNEDYATVKYNSTGVQQWVQRYNSPENSDDYANDVTVDRLGNIYVTGRSNNFSSGDDYATIKYNTAGVQQWVHRYNGDNNEIALAITTDTSGNVYVTGGGGLVGLAADILTVKYSQVLGIEPVSIEIPTKFGLYQNYPNPFNPATKIKFSIPENSYVQLKVFDMLGRTKEEIVKQELNPAVYEVSFDGTSYASGVYFYQLITNGNIIDTKKFILMK